MLSSERFSVSCPNDILGRWSMEDLVDAHLVLDMFDDLDAKSAQAGQKAGC